MSLESIVERFESITVGVVGDMAADVYVYGAASRLSREAPVLVVRHESEEVIPGCSANTMRNVLALGGSVRPFGLLGADAPGRALREVLSGERVDPSGLIESPEWKTITKTRILVGAIHRSKQQVLRLDQEPAAPANVEAETIERVGAAGGVDVWIVSDYDYGFVTPAVFEAVRATGRPVVVDSRARLLEFRGATIVTPNEEEAAAAVPMRIRTREDCAIAGRHLLERLAADSVLITRGNQGMALFEPTRPDGDFIPITGSDEITDVTGAGDTVAATLALALAAGGRPAEAMRVANHAAGVVVMKAGAATCSTEELRSALRETGA
jgi:rfaE bifunctional protein kinase chain/domain